MWQIVIFVIVYMIANQPFETIAIPVVILGVGFGIACEIRNVWQHIDKYKENKSG